MINNDKKKNDDTVSENMCLDRLWIGNVLGKIEQKHSKLIVRGGIKSNGWIKYGSKNYTSRDDNILIPQRKGAVGLGHSQTH
jgi:hypothetical protein